MDSHVIISQSDALARGAKRFFTGLPCSRGHLSERYVSTGRCCACVAEISRKWAANNPDRIKASSEDWKKRNPEAVMSRRKRWYSEGRESILQKNADWRIRNPDKAARASLAWRDSNPGYMAEYQSRYQASNKDRNRASSSKRRALERGAVPGYFGEFDAFVFREAFLLASLRSQVFGFPWQVDHLIPLACKTACGLHVGTNVQVIPAAMNRRKGKNLLYAEPFMWLVDA